MLRKRNARKALCLLTAVCLIATGFSMTGPAESYGADDTQAQYLGKIDVTGVSVNEKTRYGSDDTYDKGFYEGIIANYTDGSYSEGQPLTISTAGQLAAFAKAVSDGKDFNGKFIELTNDINLAGTKPEVTQTPTGSGSFDITISGELDKVWTPIGSSKYCSFRGTFDGGGNKITNMVVCEKASDSSYAGFFGYVDGSTIHNLGIEKACVISNSTNMSYVGGLAGHSNDSTITSCHAAADIYANADNNADNNAPSVFTGGLIGHSDNGNTITGCYGVGNFYVFGDFKAGALIGYNISSKIASCYGAGAIYASGTNTYISRAGGLVGVNGDNELSTNPTGIKNCCATSNVYASTPSSTWSTEVGSLVGVNQDAKITSCYATGNVFVFSNRASYAGGLIGRNSRGDIQTSYRNKEAKVTATQGSEGGTICEDGTELTLQQMTGIGEGRASKMMEDLGSAWTFKNDEKLAGSSVLNCYFPILKDFNYPAGPLPCYQQPVYSVTVKPGYGMTKTTASGAENQTVIPSKAMKDIIYNADSGVTFPEDYVAKHTISPDSGITVTRNSESQITISGTPKADTTITLVDIALPPAPPVTQPSGSYYGTLTADALTFPDLQAGDTPQSQSLQLRCSGSTGATITKAELSSGDFLLDDSKAEAYVGAGKTNSTYQITPKAGLSPGSYKAKVIITYGYGRIAEADVTLTVTEARQEAPAKLTAKSKNCRTIALSWTTANRAEKYQVYRATKKSGAYKRISTTTKTALNNIRLTTGKTYYYKVRAYRTVNGKKIYSSFTNIASAKPKPAAPSFSLKAGKGRITASWKSVSGATGYRIYRASAKNGKFALVKDSHGKAKSYTSAKLQSKKTYYYKMRAYRTVSGKKIYSSYTKVKNIKTK